MQKRTPENDCRLTLKYNTNYNKNYASQHNLICSTYAKERIFSDHSYNSVTLSYVMWLLTSAYWKDTAGTSEFFSQIKARKVYGRVIGIRCAT